MKLPPKSVPAVKVTLAERENALRQCPAVVTTRGWISVPVQPLTSTVLGQSQGSVGSPPTTFWTVTATCGESLESPTSGPAIHAPLQSSANPVSHTWRGRK